MDAEKRKRLEKAGWKIGTVQEFLGLSDDEMAMIEMRLSLKDSLKARRLKLGLTQQQAAKRIGSSQARVAKMENGVPGVLGPISKIGEVTAKLGIKAVILGMPRNQSVRLSRRVLQARLCGVEVLDLPTLYERVTGRIPVRYIEDQWLLFADGFYLLSKEYVQRIKRVFDFFFSGLLLSLTLPLTAVTALAVVLESKGPVFYQQQRVGKGCKVFTVYKFRSMRCHSETNGARWAQQRDPRVTRVGRWIRIFHIDELPQLWNVFKGDMSLVGPRPERPEFVKELDSHIPYYCVRHTVSPGLTGWAQINYPYGASAEDALRKLEYDLFYIKNMSVFLDFKILIKTIGVVILGEGAR